jgi:hypothetical protein
MRDTNQAWLLILGVLRAGAAPLAQGAVTQAEAVGHWHDETLASLS